MRKAVVATVIEMALYTAPAGAVATVIEMALYTAPAGAVATEVAVVVATPLRNKSFHKSTIPIAHIGLSVVIYWCQAITDSIHSFVLFT